MKKEPTENIVAGMDDEKTPEIINAGSETAETVSKSVVSAVPYSAEIEAVIRKNVYAAMGIGIVPIPVFNFAAVTTIQLNMVRQLSELYGAEFKKDIVKKIITAVISSSVPALGSTVLGNAVIGVPLVGLPLAVGSKSILGAMSTYATGQMFVNHFKRSGSLIGANLDVLKEDFSAAFQNSRQWLGNTISGQKASESTVN